MTARRAFSLIEILIAILVLAFGLLGLGALFPVVVTQQRDAADRTQGPAAAASIRASAFGDAQVVDWQAVAKKADPKNVAGNSPPENATHWNFASNEQGGVFKKLVDAFPDGSITLRTTPPQEIPVTARVYPSPFSSVAPQFVWDIAVRRTDSAKPLEVAVFVRRLDSGIRAPKGRSVANALTGLGLSTRDLGVGSPTALPVAVDPDSGRPTGNGVGDYAVLREVTLRPFETRRGTIDRCDARFAGNEATLRPYVARRGQKLLDDLGIVRTVTTVDEDGRLVVEPPFTSVAQRTAVYSPVIPVSIEIVRVEEGS